MSSEGHAGLLVEVALVDGQAIVVGKDMAHDAHSVRQIAEATDIRLGQPKAKTAKRLNPPVEKVEPEEFAKVLDELDLSRKEAAAAIGKSLSRISAHGQPGSFPAIFEAFKAACEKYAADHPRPEPVAEEVATD